MDITPDERGEQQPDADPPTEAHPKTVLLLAGACGAAAAYCARDWATGVQVFAAIVTLFTNQR